MEPVVKRTPLGPVEVLGKLGVGTYGVVMRCKYEDGRIVAIKESKRLDDGEFGLPRSSIIEVSMLKRVRDIPHIATMYNCKAMIVNGVSKVWFDAEAYDMNLYTWIKNEKEDRRISMFNILLSNVGLALYYIHRSGIVHCDVSTGNVLVKDGKFYLCDFGIARMMGNHKYLNSTKEDVVYSDGFRAPEVEIGRFGYEADIWALGACLMSLVLGRNVENEDVKNVKDRIDGVVGLRDRPETKDWIVECLIGMLMVNPAARSTIPGVLGFVPGDVAVRVMSEGGEVEGEDVIRRFGSIMKFEQRTVKLAVGLYRRMSVVRSECVGYALAFTCLMMTGKVCDVKFRGIDDMYQRTRCRIEKDVVLKLEIVVFNSVGGEIV